MKRIVNASAIKSVLLVTLILGLLPAAPAAAQAQDVVTVGTVTGPFTTVDVPVSIRDVSGTPLGIDQPAGSRIQSYSLKVDYAPAAAVQSITFTRAGITASHNPIVELNPSVPGSISLLDTFTESSDLLPFVSNAPAPGNQVGHLVVTLSPSATPGTTITLTLDPVLTQLTDQGGSGATKESTGGGNLALVNGAINVTAEVPALSHWALVLLALSLVFIAIRTRM